MLRRMKSAITALWLVVLAGLAGIATGASAALPVIRHQGRDFVRVTAWAAANGFDCGWLKRDEWLGLRSGADQVALKLDSREAKINGMGVWLLFPMVLINGSPLMSILDTETTLQPLLRPEPQKAKRKVTTICLDAGHGGKDPGHRSLGYNEKALTLLLVQETDKQLRRAGFNVVFTRRTDAFVDLPDRPALARKQGADLFLSLHCNAAESSRSLAQGCEVYCLTPAGAPSTNSQGEGADTGAYPGNRNNGPNIQLAFKLQKSLVRSLGVADRGLRRARFAVLRDASMPAVLIEAGFLSHPSEGKKLLSAGYRQRIAISIVKALQEFGKQ